MEVKHLANRFRLHQVYEMEARSSGVLSVPVVLDVQQAAARVLIRPRDVRPLARTLGFETTDDVAVAFQVLFASGVWRYVSDGRGDRWQCPLLTWALQTGDCEDWAALSVSLLRAIGGNAGLALGTLKQPWGALVGHAFCVGFDHQGFFLLEVTTGHLFRYWPSLYRAHIVVF